MLAGDRVLSDIDLCDSFKPIPGNRPNQSANCMN
jgi:hypothetical protein